jgi:hypothetical protein
MNLVPVTILLNLGKQGDLFLIRVLTVVDPINLNGD